MDRFFRICKWDNGKRRVVQGMLMIHLQFHQLAFPLHVILKVHHIKEQKLLSSFTNRTWNSTTTRTRTKTWICTRGKKKKTARPPSNVCNILLRRKMVGLIVSTVMHHMQQLVLSMEHLTWEDMCSNKPTQVDKKQKTIFFWKWDWP